MVLSVDQKLAALATGLSPQALDILYSVQGGIDVQQPIYALAPFIGDRVGARNQQNTAAAWPAAQTQGTKFAVPVGHFVASEQITINKGEVVLDYPNWNATGNFNCFGDGIKLLSGITLTFWTRQTGDAANDANSIVLGAISQNDGVTWSDPFTIFQASASTKPLYNIGVSGGLGQDPVTGRIFASLAIFYGGGTIDTNHRVNSYLIWTDDPTGQTGWSAPDFNNPMIDPGYPLYYLTASPIGFMADGTMFAIGFGPTDPTVTQNNRTCTMITSPPLRLPTDKPVWSHRSNVAVQAGNNTIDFIEPCWTRRKDGKLFVTLNQKSNLAIVFAVSNDFGATDGGWTVSKFASGCYVPGHARSSICTLDSGAMVLLTRASTTLNVTEESVLFTCRDNNGMLSTSWDTGLQFDYRHFQNEYGGVIQIRKNVVGCFFAGAQLPTRNTCDWTFIVFSDGRAIHPSLSAYLRQIECHNIAAQWQTIQPIKDAIRKIVSPATPTDIAVNAILDLLTAQGFNLQHPADAGTLVGQWDTWRVPSTVNNYVPNFTQADNASVVPAAARTNGQTIAVTQRKGTWGTLSNHLYLSATSGGAGYNPHITYPFGFGDGTATLSCLSFTGAFCIILRWIDADNFLMAYIDGTRIRLYKVVADNVSGGNLLFDGALAIGTVPVVFQVVAAGNNIQMFVNINNAGFPTSPQVNYNLIGADQTTYANTLGTWGILQFATNSNRYDSFTFTKGPLIIGTTQGLGDQFGEIPEYAGTGVGSLIQTTTNNQGTLLISPLLGRNTHAYLRASPNGANKVWYKTATFAAKPGPFTVFLAMSFTQDTGGSRSMFKLTDGVSFVGSLGVNGTTLTLGGQSGHFFSVANAFPGYAFGTPCIIRCVFNVTASQIWIDGRQVGPNGDTGSLGAGITAVQWLDEANTCLGNMMSLAVVAGGLMTPLAAHEQERQLVALLKDQGWNDR